MKYVQGCSDIVDDNLYGGFEDSDIWTKKYLLG